ncbi:helix-turn-helix domain-containing protein [Enterobacter hormaechei]|uniref:YdaS family helix-turn-helix protein n=1 Tax=Enterobacter hormaechei TaxID=158836 RepID=UPI00079AFA01|nr:YdaS family helix-turn-helix protein [Enterobacter hormaechei]HCJ6422203.1 helix-turn-helix domain-containing protein [Enterobacter hormaechei subsp. xiangfangensis]MCE1307910.1 helix-turn-helix domain-containing protein [Enterobacter hormaechei]MCM7440260.1 helix-turn-helix domain-containing protein [Enterobacter hormaechei]MDG0827110.1 helix-turn-helix domain-containing protein [Enterobacter hormaechei]MDG0847999.1 helix-turn-helix domain-containing protein [Enterobacter hormaechei]
MTNKTIQRAIDIAGSQKKLADLCGVAQPTVWRWLHGGGIDARYVMKIVNATIASLFRLMPEQVGPLMTMVTSMLGVM